MQIWSELMNFSAIFTFVSITLALLLRFCLVRENKKLEEAETQQVNIETVEKPGAAHSEIVQQGPGGLLLLNPGFRYVL
jgi:hypothetical protein